MITALEALEELSKRVQRQRKNGETDLRTTLHFILALKKDIWEGKTIEQVRNESAADDEK